MLPVRESHPGLQVQAISWGGTVPLHCVQSFFASRFFCCVEKVHGARKQAFRSLCAAQWSQVIYFQNFATAFQVVTKRKKKFTQQTRAGHGWRKITHGVFFLITGQSEAWTTWSGMTLTPLTSTTPYVSIPRVPQDLNTKLQTGNTHPVHNLQKF